MLAVRGCSPPACSIRPRAKLCSRRRSGHGRRRSSPWRGMQPRESASGCRNAFSSGARATRAAARAGKAQTARSPSTPGRSRPAPATSPLCSSTICPFRRLGEESPTSCCGPTSSSWRARRPPENSTRVTPLARAACAASPSVTTRASPKASIASPSPSPTASSRFPKRSRQSQTPARPSPTRPPPPCSTRHERQDL